jgi:hypothetical protein
MAVWVGGGGERDIVSSLRPGRGGEGWLAGRIEFTFFPLNTPHTQLHIPYKWGGIGKGALSPPSLPPSPPSIAIPTQLQAMSGT